MDSVDGEGKVQVSKKDLNDKFMNKNYSLNRKPVRDDFMYSSESSKDIDESAFGNNCKSRRRSGSTSYIRSNNCGLCFTEEMSSDKLVQNPECFHLYHKDCLGSYVQSKLDQMHFPFRCPVRSCTKPLNRLIAGECIDSKDEIAKLDFLNFINRVEKGKRIVFWCAACKDVFTLQRSQEFKCYLCKGKIYRAKTILEQKDKSFNQQEQKTLFNQLIRKLKSLIRRCLTCLLWFQNIKGAENFICKCKPKESPINLLIK